MLSKNLCSSNRFILTAGIILHLSDGNLNLAEQHKLPKAKWRTNMTAITHSTCIQIQSCTADSLVAVDCFFILFRLNNCRLAVCINSSVFVASLLFLCEDNRTSLSFSLFISFLPRSFCWSMGQPSSYVACILPPEETGTCFFLALLIHGNSMTWSLHLCFCYFLLTTLAGFSHINIISEANS